MNKLNKTKVISLLFCLYLFLLPVFTYPEEPNTQTGPPDQETLNPDIGAESSGKIFSEEIPDWKARWELAKLLSYSKRYKESVAEYKKLLQEKPDLTEASVEMAKILFWAKRPGEAETILVKIPPEKLDDETTIILADIYMTRKEYSKAENIYGQYLKKNPDDDSARLKLAEVLSWDKQYNESIEQYNILIKKHPKDNQLRRKLAEVLTWAGKGDDAIEQLRKTLE